MKKRILLLFDLASPPPADQDFSADLKTDDWATERQLINTLDKLGHEVIPFGLFDNIRTLIQAIDHFKPDLVFNLIESFSNERSFEPLIAGVLRLMNIPYTGVRPGALMLCKNKGLSKKILAYHHIRVPRFVISNKKTPIRTLRRFVYPAFVKPLGQEGSDGISQDSFSENEDGALDRVRYIHESLKCNAIVEEYIEGRELYVGVLGQKRLHVFPPRELFFTKVPEGTPKFATYYAKWNESYRKRWGIKTGPAKSLDQETLKKIQRICKRTFNGLNLDTIARIDLRLRDNGEIVVLEANPNPAIGKDEDFALSAKADGWSYEKLIQKLIDFAH